MPTVEEKSQAETLAAEFHSFASTPDTATTHLVTLWLSIGIAAFTTVIQWFRIHDTYFIFDDFLLPRLAQQTPLGWTMFRRPIFEHFSPVLWTLSKVLAGPLAMSHGWAIAMGLATSGVSVFVMHRLTLRLCRSSSVATLLTILFGLSILQTAILRWWTTSIHSNLAVTATLVSVWCFVRFQDERHRPDAVISVVLLVFALLTHEKAMLVIGYLALLWFAVYAEPLRASSFFAQVRSHLLLWSCYVGVTIASVANFYSTYYEGAESPGLPKLATFVGRSLFVTFLPAFLNVRYPEVLGGIGPLVPLILVIALVALFAASIRRSKAALRGWAFIAIALLVNVVVLGQARAEIYGLESADVLQYQQELALLLPVGLAIVARWSRIDAIDWTAHLRPTMLSAASILAVSYVVLSIQSNRVVEDEFDAGELSKAFLSTLRADVAALPGSDAPPAVLDGTVSNLIMDPVFAPYNSTSNIAAVMGIPISDGAHAAHQSIYYIDDLGHLHRYDLVDPWRSGAGSIDITYGEPSNPGCVTTTAAGGASLHLDTAPLEFAESASPLVLRLEVNASAPIELAIYGGMDLESSQLSKVVYLPAGVMEYDIELAADQFDHLDFGVLPNGERRTICVTEVAIAPASPAP